MSEYYVYGLFEPQDCKLNSCFYIGKGKGSRLNLHFSPSRLKEDSGGNIHKKRKKMGEMEKVHMQERFLVGYLNARLLNLKKE